MRIQPWRRRPFSSKTLNNSLYFPILGGPYQYSNHASHSYKNWLLSEDRTSRLTASTFGLALGFHKGRRMQVWLEKIGLLERFRCSPATEWNNRYEAKALERYREITGNHVEFTGLQVHGQWDFLAASPDGVINPWSHNPGVLEIKCPYFEGNPRGLYPWEELKFWYMPQVQGLMEILDLEWMDFHVWTFIGNSIFRVERNRRYWEMVMEGLGDFWWDHVMPARRVRERDPLANVSRWRPESRHRLFEVIKRESELVCDSSRLIFTEIHGDRRIWTCSAKKFR